MAHSRICAAVRLIWRERAAMEAGQGRIADDPGHLLECRQVAPGGGPGRAYPRRGMRVRPFKPQNMSNNAAVTADGGEIGRAQALQARACGIEPVTDMNPVLLKPQSETGAQVVVQGRVLRSCSARDYHALKPQLLPRVLESFAARAAADLVLVEGAGSPAEVNLRAGRYRQHGLCARAGVPVVFAGDIERGGVIAQLVGTVLLLEPEERRCWWLHGQQVLRRPGAVRRRAPAGSRRARACACWAWSPGSSGARSAQGGHLGLAELARARHGRPADPVAVPRLPRLANFDDLDPLVAEPDVDLRVLEPGQPLPAETDLVLLPGSKATLDDLAALRARRAGCRHQGPCTAGRLRAGAVRRLSDAGAADRGSARAGGARGADGLGLLEVETVLEPAKMLALRAWREVARASPCAATRSTWAARGPGLARPMLRDGPCGWGVSADGRVMGCYLHGILAADGFRGALLGRIRGGWPPWPTRRGSRGRWTGSPPISSTAWISTGCCPGALGPQENRRQRDGREHQPPGSPGQRDRTVDLGRRHPRHCRRPSSHRRPCRRHRLAGRQAQAQGGGHGGLGPAGVGRAVDGASRSMAAAEGMGAPPTRQQQRTGEAGWHKVDQIVELGHWPSRSRGSARCGGPPCCPAC